MVIHIECTQSNNILVNSGTIRIPNKDKLTCFLLFTDEYIRFKHIYILKSKQQVPESFRDFNETVNNRLKHKIN